MNKGDCINGYLILQDFSTAGGGLSKWSFGVRAGREYFIKEFLAPTYPTPGAPGSEASKRRRLERCQQFEKHHEALHQAVKDACSESGNLIFALDFFRDGTKYYKVTSKVDVSTLRVADVAKLPFDRRLLILRTIAHSLQILHKAGIVHGDLKPDNILIKETVSGYYTSKLIDFDNSYFSGRPPELSSEVVGDMVYYSPELAGYVASSPGVVASSLTVASDIFALGLIYHQYLTGNLPGFEAKKYQYACDAVRQGETLRIYGAALPDTLAELLRKMLDARPESRPSVSDVFASLKGITTSSSSGSTSTDGLGTKMRMTMATARKEESTPTAKASAMGGREPSDPTPSPEASGSKLRGRLITRFRKE